MLDQELPDDIISQSETTETQNVSEQQLHEQNFKDLQLDLNRDKKDEYFNCQEGSNALTEFYILSTSCKTKIWKLLLTLYTLKTNGHNRRISPPHFELYFLIDS